MSGSVQISSPAQLSSLLSSSRVVVVNFYNEWSQACQTINPVYDQLANSLSRSGNIAFAKVDAEQQTEIAQSYSATSPPLFIIFKNGNQVSKFAGSNIKQLSDAIKNLAAEAEGGQGGFGEASSSGGGAWRGADLPRGYTDVTAEVVDVRGLDLLNSDSDFGGVRTLFEASQPSALAKGKGKGKGASTGSEGKKDWVESDVDEQLMLYIPFTSTLKIHTIHITSCPPEDDDDETPSRPKTIRLYTNKQHNLGFEEAEDIAAVQQFELKASDWDANTKTAKLELRFVKFQNVSSLVLFVVDGDGESEKTRIDRIKFIGESGEKREIGKLEKIGHDD